MTWLVEHILWTAPVLSGLSTFLIVCTVFWPRPKVEGHTFAAVD